MPHSTPSGPKDLGGIFSERRQHYDAAHSVMTEMADVFNDNLPARYNDYFPEGMHVHVANQIKLAVQDLAGMAAKPFPFFVAPRKDTGASRREAELVENIHYGYRDAAERCGLGPGFDYVNHKINFWKILADDAVGVVWPSYEHQTPYFDFRDPRTHLPPIGWGPWTRSPLNGTMFAYLQTIGQLKELYPDKAQELNNRANKSNIGIGAYSSGPRSTRQGDSREMWVMEYFHEDAWYACADGDVVLLQSETGDKNHPDVCPVFTFTGYSPDQPKGRPHMAGQVSLQAAQARILSQGIDYGDESIYGQTYIIGDVDVEQLERGPDAINVIRPSGGGQADVKRLGPTSNINSHQNLAMLAGLSRALNRNPESSQGGGPAESAKALNELKNAITSYITDTVWPDTTEGWKQGQRIAAQMDCNLWGNVKKSSTGYRGKSMSSKKGGYNFTVDYTPNVNLRPYLKDLKVEKGYGLGGYQGLLEIWQSKGAEEMSLDTALEMDHRYQNPQDEKRRIMMQRLDDANFQNLMAQAQGGLLQPGAFYEIKKLMAEKNIDFDEAMAELEAEGRLLVPPVQEAGLPGGGGGDPLAALLGGMGGQDAMAQGAVPAQPPTLNKLRKTA